MLKGFHELTHFKRKQKLLGIPTSRADIYFTAVSIQSHCTPFGPWTPNKIEWLTLVKGLLNRSLPQIIQIKPKTHTCDTNCHLQGNMSLEVYTTRVCFTFKQLLITFIASKMKEEKSLGCSL